MTQIRLPDDKCDAIVAGARREYDITDDDDRRVSQTSVWSACVALVALVAVGVTLWNQWGVGVAYFFFISIIGPVTVFGTTYVLLRHLLTGWLVPSWSVYEKAKQQRIRVATEQYKRQVMQTAAYWQNLDGHAFEREFARLLTRHGYRTEVTRGSGDGGVDIIADDGNGLIAVQCKRHKNPVGPAVIRELYGAVTAGKYRTGMLAVTGGVTKGVHEFIEGKPLQIVDLLQIVQLQMELNEKGRGE